MLPVSLMMTIRPCLHGDMRGTLAVTTFRFSGASIINDKKKASSNTAGDAVWSLVY